MANTTVDPLFFNITYPVVAPIFHYRPFPYTLADEKNGNLAGTNWNLKFDGDPVHQTPGSLGIGNASVTGTIGDLIVWNYTGQNCYINRTTNATIATKLVLHVGPSAADPANFDETSQWHNQVKYAWHNASYSLVDSDTDIVTVNSITLTHGLVTNATSMDQVQVTTEHCVVDGELNPKWNWRGTTQRAGGYTAAKAYGWTVNTTLGPDNNSGQTPIDYISAAVNAGSEETLGSMMAQLEVPIPQNTSFVVVNGTLGPNYGQWIFYFRESLPYPTASDLSGLDLRFGVERDSVYVKTANPFVVPNVPLVTVPLDPTLNYSVVIYQTGGSRTVGGLSSFTFYSSIGKSLVDDTTNGTAGENNSTDAGKESSSNSNGISISKGAIAGIVVAIVVALGLVIAAAWWFVCYRDRRRRPAGDDFVIDSTTETRAVPFVTGPSTVAAQGQALTETSDSGLAAGLLVGARGGKGREAGNGPLVRPAVHELDANEVVDDEPERLPPVYKESWAPPPGASGMSDSGPSSGPSSAGMSSSSAMLSNTSPDPGDNPRQYDYDSLLSTDSHSAPLMSTPMMFGASGAGKPQPST